MRSLAHPSFANEGNIGKWIETLFLNKQYFVYLIVLIITLLFSLYSIFSITIGYYIFIKSSLLTSLISILVIMFFCIITGPTISPKYSLPYLPILIYLQAIAFDKLILFIKNIVKR